jgi:alpha-beta hydrolase superfamily lysophospholipase
MGGAAVEVPPPSRPRVAPPWWIAAASLLALLLLGLGIGLLASAANQGVTRERAVVEGVPLVLLRPTAQADPLPGLVVAHGFAGSAALMDALATSWARAGFAVAVPDQLGHGSNPARLPAQRGTELAEDLAVVAGWLQAQPGVVDRPPFLVGHSMGAGAVVDAAVANPDVVSTVALSLPSADAVPDGEPAVPRNLLLLWGSAEPDRFADAALAALGAAYPQAEPGELLGSFADGTARQAQEIPGAEHLSILWRTATAQAVADWLHPQAGLAGGVVVLQPRMLWAGLAALGLVLAVIPASTLLLGDRRPPPAAAQRLPRVAIGLLAAAVAGSLVAAAAAPWTDLLPLAVGGHLAVWFGAAAVVLLLVARRTPEPAPRPRTLRAAALLGLGAALLLAVPARLSWAPVALVGPRPLLVLLFATILLAWFAGEARLLRGPRPRQAGLMVVSRVLLVGALLAGVALLGAPGFLTLLLPLMVPLLVLLGAAAWIVAGRTASSWPVAAVQALPLALIIGTTFPLIG